MVEQSDVYIVKTRDRTEGINLLLDKFNLEEFSGRSVAVKPNFNSSDPFPASTHLQTLEALTRNLQKAGASEIITAERSGMGKTRDVLDKLGVSRLAEEMGFKLVVLDDEEKEGWIKIKGEGNHWLRGFYVSKIFLDAEKVVQTCCLKTHRFGGDFTLSLKNSVGLVAKKVPGNMYDYMAELHLSPHQRKMIAEINLHYPVDLVLMDGMKAFLNKGPERGVTAEPNILIAAKDRVAIDAVGVAVLRHYGTTDKVTNGPIFAQEQIKRAVELDIGAASALDINLIPVDDESKEITQELTTILEEQG